MKKNYKGIALLCALALGVPMVHAAEPAINVRQLGLLDRVVKYCAPVDADVSHTLEGRVAELLKGATPNAVAEARSSPDYMQAYATMDQFIAQVDPRNAKIVCSDAAKNNRK